MVLDKANFIIRGKREETVYKNPGTLNGYDFVIEDCVDCEIYVLDHTSQVQIDDCINCKIFIGPSAGSTFFRDCKDCTIEVACQQLRTRDVHKCTFGLYCKTKPIVETSTNVVFRCWMGAYPGLSEHFKATEMNPLENTWNEIYDFNQGEDLGDMHWSIMDIADYPADFWQVVPPKGEDGVEFGPPDNPVVLPDGRSFTSEGAPAPASADAADAADAEPPTEAAPADSFEDPFAETPAPSDSTPPMEDPPAAAPPAASDLDFNFEAVQTPPAEPNASAGFGSDDLFGAAPVAVDDLPPAPLDMDPTPIAPAAAVVDASDDLFSVPAPAPAGGDVEMILPEEPEPLAPPVSSDPIDTDTGFTSIDSGFTSAAPAAAAPVPAVNTAELEARSTQEAEARAKIQEEAASYLKKFYDEREANTQQRMKTNREVENNSNSLAASNGVVSSDGIWASVISLIDFAFKTSDSTTDLSKFKACLFAAKGNANMNALA